MTSSGTFFTRWGRKTSPSGSKRVYVGQMTGPSWRSGGGGSNYQCLPYQAEYTHYAPTAGHSSLRAAHYRLGPHLNHRIPCAVCETGEGRSQLMLPARIQCPIDAWKLEYRGNMVSTAEYERHSEDFWGFSQAYFRSSYICMDEHPESLTSRSYGRDGPQVYLVNAAYGSGWSGALENTVGYRKNTALSCVVCSK